MSAGDLETILKKDTGEQMEQEELLQVRCRVIFMLCLVQHELNFVNSMHKLTGSKGSF